MSAHLNVNKVGGSGQISVLSATLRNAIYSGMHRNATTVVHMRDHEVEMELDAERRRVQMH